jgi:hypothetical protein
MNTTVETEILAALAKAGLHVRSFARISKLRLTETGRVAYRIDHEHGIVKARLLEDERAARDLAVFRNELGDAFVPVIFRHGRVLIEDWIEGDALPDIPEPPHLVKAGALLGEMHARLTIAGRALHEVRPTADHLLAAEMGLRIAAATGALEEDIAARLELALQRLDPLQTTYGLVHLDFCGDNMVIDRAGRLRVVDNERIRLDSLGYDLGRTWYRWALPPQEWNYFCTAYASRVPFPKPLDSLRFWKIVAAAGSAELRLRAYPEKADVPLECLRTLAAEEIS